MDLLKALVRTMAAKTPMLEDQNAALKARRRRHRLHNRARHQQPLHLDASLADDPRR